MIQCNACLKTNQPNASHCSQCGCPLSAIPSLAITNALPSGTKLHQGRYTIGKVLGAGGFGITYLGAHVHLKCPVAIKELFPPGCKRNSNNDVIPDGRICTQSTLLDFVSRLMVEGQKLAALNHPGIVNVRDFFEENNTAYLVMEFIEGQSLQEVFDKQFIPRQFPDRENAVISYISKVLDALEVVHNANMIHCDIKPVNIMVANDGRVVLIDFGAAKTFVANQTTQLSQRVVSDGYSPMELYSTSAKLGTYIDVYSVSAMMYYLLTSRLPEIAMNRADALIHSKPDPLQDVKQLASGLSNRTSKVVMKGLAINALERPQSATKLKTLLLGTAAPQCPHCGSQLSNQDNVYCVKCAHLLAQNRSCPHCSQVTPDHSTASYCVHCGQAL